MEMIHRIVDTAWLWAGVIPFIFLFIFITLESDR